MKEHLELIKQLRKATLAGFSDCKKALDQNNYNYDAAIKWLKINGIAKAEVKNANKIASEGTTWAQHDENGGAMIELNTETDFTGRSALILDLAKEIINLILKNKISDLDVVLSWKLNDLTVKDALLEASHKTGEKISLQRIFYLKKSNNSISTYKHGNGKVSAIVEVEGSVEDNIIKGLSMHIASMNPKFIDKKSVNQDWLEQEKQIIIKQLEQENKPTQFIDKIIIGRVDKMLSDVCLLNQSYIFDTKITVEDYLKNNNIIIKSFKYFQLGENIIK